MRIAAITVEAIVNTIYRVIVPMQALAQRGHQVHVEERNVIADAGWLRDVDLVHFTRHSSRESQRAARWLKANGVAVVWDNDDDLIALPKDNPRHAEQSGMRGQAIWAGMKQMMRCADLVTTPSEVLAERYRAAGADDVRVLGNYLPPVFSRPARVPESPGVTLGWLAAYEHMTDFERLRLRPTLTRLLAQHPTLKIATVGVNLGLESPRYRHTPITPYGELPAHLARFDVGIAPLADIRFNRARSDVKVKEYAACGVPWLASRVGAYAGLGEEQGGRLVPDDRWHEEIERLVTDAVERRRLSLAASRWAAEQRIERHVDRWERAFEDVVARVAAPTPR